MSVEFVFWDVSGWEWAYWFGPWKVCVFRPLIRNDKNELEVWLPVAGDPSPDKCMEFLSLQAPSCHDEA